VTTEQQFLKKFGKRLATIRRQKGITQEKLAELVDVHRTYIGFIEAGKRNPSIGNIHKIAKALKVHFSDLVQGL
jgi:transcriptional regulator with XRE-family HTH domain